MARFVQAVNTATGVKARVPEHFIGHPTLGKNLKLAPSEKGSATITPKSTSETDKTKKTTTKEDGNAEDHR